MDHEIALLYDYLAVGAVLFGVGLIGFLSRRNMIVMFLSAEMMLQGVSLSLVAWSRFHNDFGGQMLVDLHHCRGGLRSGHRPGHDAHALPTQRQAGHRRLAGRSRGQSTAVPGESRFRPERRTMRRRLAAAWPRRALRRKSPRGRDSTAPPRTCN